MTTPDKRAPKKTAAAPKAAAPVKILPISAEDLRDPKRFSTWVFCHGPLILQELFNNLPQAMPNERVKVLAALYQTTLSFRPYVTQEATGDETDPAAQLAALLSQPVPEDL